MSRPCIIYKGDIRFDIIVLLLLRETIVFCFVNHCFLPAKA